MTPVDRLDRAHRRADQMPTQIIAKPEQQQQHVAEHAVERRRCGSASRSAARSATSRRCRCWSGSGWRCCARPGRRPRGSAATASGRRCPCRGRWSARSATMNEANAMVWRHDPGQQPLAVASTPGTSIEPPKTKANSSTNITGWMVTSISISGIRLMWIRLRRTIASDWREQPGGSRISRALERGRRAGLCGRSSEPALGLGRRLRRRPRPRPGGR